jgi:sugar phosphate isomerase/epimerase
MKATPQLLLYGAVLMLIGLTANARTNQFFAFDNGVGRGEWSPAKQARTLRELGYAGIGFTGTGDISNRLAACRAEDLKIFSLYVHGFIEKPVRFEPGLTNALRQLRGTDAIIWLTVREIKGEHDVEAAQLVREVADLAAAEGGLRVVLYPHKGFYVATADDAFRVLRQVNRTNVGVSLNLCHELMSGNGDRLPEIIRECGSKLWLVSINGADRGTTAEQTIKVLGEGSFDVRGFLHQLDVAGYAGPIGLQCFNLKGDPEENLRRSIAAWRQLMNASQGAPHNATR